jgi:hypothetical protein
MINQGSVPWNESTSQLEIRTMKESFITAPKKDIPIIFRGIRQYIVDCTKMAYKEEPNYDYLSN